ncbi:MsnO8 family LLM class oxidoreductase [Actinoplanes sp. NPDC051859]|uniref:MsnO8 family LLM class oxidoreductase n=1 Tax=Actinoplanes sp. NPDC051859 TaxID=3363909 RepID=UPI00379EF87B
MRLSVLESTAAPQGQLAYDALQQSIVVARAAEFAGYHRIWVTEHHAEPTIASSAPAVLIAALAARTATIRVGAGGVMLVNHPPLVVAEQFATLEALHPGRIDLGVGAAAGVSSTSAAVREALGSADRVPAAHPARLDELIGFVRADLPADHPFRTVEVAPRVRPVPVFVLGSSVRGAELAAARGLPFAFAHHLGATRPEPVLARYRSKFRGIGSSPQAYAIISVAVLCAESDRAAERLAGQVIAGYGNRRRGTDPGGVGSLIVGGPQTVADRLSALAETTGADEVMVAPIERDGPGRVRTLRQIADGFIGYAAAARSRPAGVA